MAQIKAHQVEAYLRRPDPAHAITLIYGPDAGLVSERASLLARASGVDLKDDFATVKLDAEDAASDTNRVTDEALTVSMFGGKRLIWISGNTARPLVKAIEPLFNVALPDTFILIEAGDLKKTNALRKRIEKEKTAVALPCFQDAMAALNSVIDDELQKTNLAISRDARRLLLDNLGGDRRASRGEVQKLTLYAMGENEITVDHVREIVGDASALTSDTVINAATLGDVETMDHMLKRLTSQGMSLVPIVNAMLRNFQQLHQLRALVEAQNMSAQAAVSGLRPPVYFDRRDTLIKAVSLWPRDALTRALARLDKMAFESRTNATLDTSLVTTALLAIALEARALGRRRR
ncbi:MAG: DNA polymerase III subunit delta [Pseudomonadota bacterium]